MNNNSKEGYSTMNNNCLTSYPTVKKYDNICCKLSEKYFLVCYSTSCQSLACGHLVSEIREVLATTPARIYSEYEQAMRNS